ncbi:MAG: type II toxin-antitoxin system HicB family antitoxin [Candidatus Lactobacillus pullistercoris]|uniref:Type II toxin-antitoxin system HicB family antitoxin n=1 Tax=Candidatus Lactobacillus pullistercoris TaxID=2838636 RepID=A0A9E2KRB9_9LACO|nr:type II toxin-antitoxin system HicB family antitoxin [Candidatus Lactobacillus pullistercoris]
MNKQFLKYKGYRGSVEYSLEDNILFGKIIGIKGLISYDGKTIEELKKHFKRALDDYLDLCKQKGIKPEKEYKGNFNVRISPKLHQKLEIYSENQHQSLNKSVEQAIDKFLTRN